MAKQSIFNDRSKFMNYFATKIENYDVALIFCSGAGGFGSGSITTLTSVLRQLSPKLAINLVIAMPALSEGKISIKNALKLHSMITKLRLQGVINSYQYIDNNKMKKEEEFNKECMQLILNSYELQEGAVDISDTKIINSANKYKVILPLINTFKSLVDAIDYSMDNSPFVVPSNLSCSYMGGIFIKNDYDKDEWEDLFKVKMWGKTDYGTKNLMVLGGVSAPDEYIQTLEEAYKNLEDDKIDEAEEIFEFKEDIKSKEKNNEKKNEEPITKQKLIDMMNAEFWDNL